MSEEKASGGIVKGLCFWIGLLVLAIISTGIHAQWQAYVRYKKISADKYTIKLVLDDNTEIDVPAGHYIKEFRVQRRVDIIENNKKTKKIFYNPKKVIAPGITRALLPIRRSGALGIHGDELPAVATGE